MEDKRFAICVKRINRIQVLVVCLAVILIAYGASAWLENAMDITIKGEIILLLLVAGMCFLLTKFEWIFPDTERMDVIFGEDEVSFVRGRKKRSIFYSDIREVEKMMIINRYHSEKGYYRVKIKTKGCAYVIYSGEDSNQRLDFSEVGVAKIYMEFQRRGFKCC